MLFHAWLQYAVSYELLYYWSQAEEFCTRKRDKRYFKSHIPYKQEECRCVKTFSAWWDTGGCWSWFHKHCKSGISECIIVLKCLVDNWIMSFFGCEKFHGRNIFPLKVLQSFNCYQSILQKSASKGRHRSDETVRVAI